MRLTTLIVPCYNEEKRLSIDRFRQFAVAWPQIRFVMVDDGSQDGTAGLLAALVAARPGQFRVVRLATNCGKGEAVRRGMLHALRDEPAYVGFIDADLSAPLDEVWQMIDVLEQRDEVHMVLGSRLPSAGNAIERRPCRQAIGACFSALAAGMLGLSLRDTQCGLKLFRSGDATRRLFAEPFRSRWIFDVEVLARFVADHGRQAASAKIHEAPLARWREVAGSKLRRSDFVRAVGELLGIYLTYIRGQTRNESRVARHRRHSWTNAWPSWRALAPASRLGEAGFLHRTVRFAMGHRG